MKKQQINYNEIGWILYQYVPHSYRRAAVIALITVFKRDPAFDECKFAEASGWCET